MDLLITLFAFLFFTLVIIYGGLRGNGFAFLLGSIGLIAIGGIILTNGIDIAYPLASETITILDANTTSIAYTYGTTTLTTALTEIWVLGYMLCIMGFMGIAITGYKIMFDAEENDMLG